MMQDFCETDLQNGSTISHRPHSYGRYAPYQLHPQSTTFQPAYQICYAFQNGLTTAVNSMYPFAHTVPSKTYASSSYNNNNNNNSQSITTMASNLISSISANGMAQSVSEGAHISCLYPEIMAMIFEKLSVRDRGRAARVCSAWRDAADFKSVWRGVEARLHIRRPCPILYSSLVKRGIRKIQILSLRRSIRNVVVSVTNLQSLSLSGCYHINDSNLINAIAMTKLPSLKTLDLSLCKQITDQSILKISPFIENVETLELGGCSNISNSALKVIQQYLHKLKRLNLRSCWLISDEGISFLAGKHLQEESPTNAIEGNDSGGDNNNGGGRNLLNASGSNSSTSSADNTVEKIENIELKLEYIGLQDCQRLSDDALRYIAQGLQSLECINFSFCVSITDSGLKHLAKMPKLKELNLRSCDNITDIGMAYLTEGGSTITSLDVSFCEKISDQALIHLSQGLFRLKSLSLNHCQVTDIGLARIANSLIELEVLNIGQCNRITDYGLQMVTQMKKLKTMDLYGCNQLSPLALSNIMRLPKLARVNLGLWIVLNHENPDC